MQNKYDMLFKAGIKAQLEKLLENAHKQGFDKINIEYGIKRIEEELQELQDVVKKKYDNDMDLTTWYSEIRKESADIANFAHMIILQCDKWFEMIIKDLTGVNNEYESGYDTTVSKYIKEAENLIINQGKIE